jgi:Fis family transcriptional regulator
MRGTAGIKARTLMGLRPCGHAGNVPGPVCATCARDPIPRHSRPMSSAAQTVVKLRPPAAEAPAQQPALREAVSRSVRRYLSDLGDHRCDDLYRLVLGEIEGPLLDEVLTHCRGNQTKAAQLLGITRATLRKKLAALGRH